MKVLEENYEYVLFESSHQMSEALEALNKASADFFVFSFKGEKSLICNQKDRNFDCLKSHGDWTGIKIEGEMPFGTVQGLISTLSSPLAKEGIGVCVVSTFLTDLFLVKKGESRKGKSNFKS